MMGANALNEESIYKMTLHEEIFIRLEGDERLYILRVPGGWIYKFYLEEKEATAVFVKYDIEFED